MKDLHSQHHHHGHHGRRKSTADGPGMQVICLGSGGGPAENDITGLLVRSIAAKWAKGSILAVDAGRHLAAITSILSEHFPLVAEAPATSSVDSDDSKRSSSPEDVDQEPPVTVLTSGPFAGLACPHASSRANAVHVVREHISTYLITHPHLDHFCGFAINTAAFHNTSRPKRLAALPFTVNAIKNNIFNDVIWPNLTDEDNGVGFVTFQRLTEGGNLALGDGESRGFIEVCDGLAVKGFKISHGTCASRPPQTQTASATVALQDSLGRRPSLPTAALPDGTWIQGVAQNNGVATPSKSLPLAVETSARRTSLIYGSQPATPASSTLAHQASSGVSVQAAEHQDLSTVVDSSAYFIRAEQPNHPQAPGREILVFGDVEPDSVSMIPRNQIVWAEAAPKVVSGVLKAVFIECSYSDVQGDAVLFGHLAPRHLIQELLVLADMVNEERRRESIGLGSSGPSQTGHQERDRKRKRVSLGTGTVPVRTMHAVDENGEQSSGTEAVNPGGTSVAGATASTTSYITTPRSKRRGGNILVETGELGSMPETQTQDDAVAHDPVLTPMDLTAEADSTALMTSVTGPLHGFTVVVIHVKDTLTDGPLVGDVILSELKEHEAGLADQGRPLGCDFIVSKSGESYWF